VRSGFQAVVVPSGFRTRVQPHRWITTWWWNQHYADVGIMPMPGGPALVSGGARAGEFGIIYRLSRKARSGSGGR
jgi:hypothetical protein